MKEIATGRELSDGEIISEGFKAANEMIKELRERLNNGRNYLMGVNPSELNVEDALKAFGYNSNGF
jgi:hypothetical protein